MKHLYLLSFFLLLVSSCGNGARRLSPFRWEAVEPQFDTIMLRLETGFQDYVLIDSLRNDVARLDKLASGCDSTDLRWLRSRFWRVRLLQREGFRDSAAEEVRHLLAVTDSAGHTYDFFRLRGILRQLTKSGDARSYRDIDQEARFYEKIGDAPMTAVSYITLGTKLYPIGEVDKSLEYMRKADKINSSLGFHTMVKKNAINIANIEFRRGNDSVASAMLAGLLDSPEIASDSGARNLVLRNLYAHTGNVEWLRRAYRGVAGDNRQRGLQGLYQALLSSFYEESGSIDSAMLFSRLAMGNMKFLNDYDARGRVMQAYATTMEHEGKNDSALIYLKRYIEYMDSDYVGKQQAEVLRMANMREVSLAMTRENERVQRLRFEFIVALFLVIMVAAGVYFLLYRRQKRHEITSRDSRLEMEKNRRHLLAVMLAMEEKNNMFKSLKTEIEGMRKEGAISVPEAVRLENSIKLHLAGGEGWDTFQQLFVQVNPDFVSRLHDAYPTLSDSYLKLATYIYMGLDNNKIARLLVIRPESVKQARWRLRRMMGLGKDVSLDEAIRSLGN